eukprot:642915_1
MPNIEREQEEIKRGLLNLVQKDGNNKCADCGALRPRWASVNLGVFVCIRCSGVHRDLGVHISVVRSISLDKWRTEWVKVMKKRGNVRVNKEYAARLPEHEKIDPEADGSHRTQFIRAKYADKRYFKAKSKAPKAAKASKADDGGRFRKCVPPSGSDSSGEARAHRKSRRHARARHRRRKSPAPSPLPSPAPSTEVSDSESPEESGAKRRHRRKQKRHAKAEKTEGKRHTKPEKAGGKRHAKPEKADGKRHRRRAHRRKQAESDTEPSPQVSEASESADFGDFNEAMGNMSVSGQPGQSESEGDEVEFEEFESNFNTSSQPNLLSQSTNSVDLLGSVMGQAPIQSSGPGATGSAQPDTDDFAQFNSGFPGTQQGPNAQNGLIQPPVETRGPKKTDIMSLYHKPTPTGFGPSMGGPPMGGTQRHVSVCKSTSNGWAAIWSAPVWWHSDEWVTHGRHGPASNERHGHERASDQWSADESV